MNTPVIFDLAKLLKEKEFPQPKTKSDAEKLHLQFNWYNEDGVYNANYKFDTTINAPTIAEVVMWLYEQHGIWISAIPNETKLWKPILIFNNEDTYDCYSFNTPTEAYLSAIEHTLNNLIK